MNAFITGSRAYGKPRKNSDLDLVILCSEAAELQIRKAADCPSGPIRFDNLNLVVCTSPEDFAAWKYGTDQLRKRGEPVTREDAITYLKRIRGEDASPGSGSPPDEFEDPFA